MDFTLKDRVLRYNQEALFALYFNISIEDINWSTISNRNKLINPLRNENNPSLTFKWFGNRLFSRDWGDMNYSGDIFTVCGNILNKNPNDPDDFVFICNDILNRIYKVQSKKIIISNEDIESETSKGIIKLDYIERTLQKRDYCYFNSFGILNSQVRKYVSPISKYFINGKMSYYKDSKLDPCYKYNINRDYVKLYFPFRNRKSKYPRFITNNILPIDDITDLKPSKDIILIKSIKDKMLIEQFIKDSSIENILPLTVSSESNILHDSILKLLKQNVKYNIFSMFDLDNVGINQMQQYEHLYGFKPLYFNTNGKDPTDYTKKYGYNKGLQSFRECLSIIIDNRNKKLLKLNNL